MIGLGQSEANVCIRKGSAVNAYPTEKGEYSIDKNRDPIYIFKYVASTSQLLHLIDLLLKCAVL